MKFLQKLGKALMLPVAVLPICGILMGIGYWLCPATMQGGEIQGVANLILIEIIEHGAHDWGTCSACNIHMLFSKIFHANPK